MESSAAKAYPLLTSLGVDIQSECIGCPLLGILEAKLDQGLTDLEDKSEFAHSYGSRLLEEADMIQHDEKADLSAIAELSSKARQGYVLDQAVKLLGDGYDSKQAAVFLQKGCPGKPAKFIISRWGPVICKSPSRAAAAPEIHSI
jgi:hypothetical protein